MSNFEKEKNRKAFLYTLGICGSMLVLFFLISWKTAPPTIPVAQDLIEVNLGNDFEGLGEEQPLIKGQRSPASEESQSSPANTAQEAPNPVTPDDNADEDAASVPQVTKNKPRATNDKTPADQTAKTNQKPKLTYNGNSKENGNNDEEDNGYRYQGKDNNGKGDAGSPDGNKDSYGSNPGGRIGNGPTVFGDRKITKNYSFTGNLKKATVYAIVKVSPAGKGTFVSFDKGSSTRNPAYKDAIINYLNNISFDRSEKESIVKVLFKFNVN